MNADAEFLDTVRDYLRAEEHGYCAIDTVTHTPRSCYIAVSVDLRAARERLERAIEQVTEMPFCDA